MGQKLTGQMVDAETERLLRLALVLLDETGHFQASAYVAQGLAILTRTDATQVFETKDFFVNTDALTPSWGVPVDK